jgi:glucose/arabinose dehydrogenase
MRALAIAASLLVLAAGCAGDESEPEDATQTSGETSAEPPPTTETGEDGSEPERGGPLRLQRFASGVDSPLYLTSAPGEPDRLYVVEQGGRVAIVDDGEVLGERFLDISGEIVAGGEQGLLGLAFHPEYASNDLLYVHFTNDAGDTRVVEYRAKTNGRGVEESSARVLFEAEQPYANHNGGQLAFGPDGRLWLGLGDGGSGGDPENRAQDLSSPLGKIHAIDVDSPEPTSEIVAYGLRNPWRFSFDRASGDVWIGDVGQSEFEEIDRLPAGEVGELANFGWDAFEGRERFEDKEPTAEGTLVEPTVVYSHSQGCSVTGGYVYRGEDVPSAEGRYFFGDYCSGRVWSTGPGGNARREPFEVDALVSFGEDAEGELYLLSLGGTIFRLAD